MVVTLLTIRASQTGPLSVQCELDSLVLKVLLERKEFHSHFRGQGIQAVMSLDSLHVAILARSSQDFQKWCSTSYIHYKLTSPMLDVDCCCCLL